jgi:hypothetical protein
MDYSIWRTRQGEFLKISDMTSQHIQNCIAMIERSEFDNGVDIYEPLPEPDVYYVDYELYKPYLKVFKKELESR